MMKPAVDSKALLLQQQQKQNLQKWKREKRKRGNQQNVCKQIGRSELDRHGCLERSFF